MNDVSQAVAIRIKELLKQKGISQYRLERKMGISHDTVKNIIIAAWMYIFQSSANPERIHRAIDRTDKFLENTYNQHRRMQ